MIEISEMKSERSSWRVRLAVRNKKARAKLSITFFFLPLKIGKRQIKERQGDKNKEDRECWCPDGVIKKINKKREQASDSEDGKGTRRRQNCIYSII